MRWGCARLIDQKSNGALIGVRLMIEPITYEELLEQNRAILARHAARHDMNGVRDIEIASRYADRDCARAARSYIVGKYGEQDTVIFRVSSVKYSADDVVINLTVDLRAAPKAELITQYEFMLIDAAERFGGELPCWEIAPK